MRSVVVYDSRFGHTEAVARAVAGALAEHGGVEVRATTAAVDLGRATPDLLVVGGPTQRRRVSPELDAFLDGLARDALRGVAVAAFDTRYRMAAWLSGSAAKRIAKVLRRRGGELVVTPESFFIVKDEPPPGQKRRHDQEDLEAGELERAAAWGARVAAALADRGVTSSTTR